MTNSGTAPDGLSCAGTDVAAQCQIHTMGMENGVMKMRPVEGGLEIKPGETVTLKPGGDHMMFVKLKHPLQTGNAVEATLQFEKAGAVKIEMPVVAIGAAAPGAQDALRALTPRALSRTLAEPPAGCDRTRHWIRPPRYYCLAVGWVVHVKDP
jgi:hypothetical protein